jgi:hypothetical protein
VPLEGWGLQSRDRCEGLPLSTQAKAGTLATSPSHVETTHTARTRKATSQPSPPIMGLGGITAPSRLDHGLQ